MKINTVLVKVGTTPDKKFMTEEACKSIVERFKKNPDMSVTIGNSKLVTGKVLNLEFRDNEVIATIEMNIIFSCAGRILQELHTMEGIRVIDCDVLGIGMFVLPIGGQNVPIDVTAKDSPQKSV
jgi:hypothetical protein